jgi:hypothetical protein
MNGVAAVFSARQFFGENRRLFGDPPLRPAGFAAASSAPARASASQSSIFRADFRLRRVG